MQSNGRTKLKRMEISYKNSAFKFLINPEDYNVSEPNRVNATQTLGGFWIDAFGAGLRELSVKGTTGLTAGTSNANTGIDTFKELRELIRTAFSSENNLRTSEEITPMKFFNFTDEDYYWVIPTNFDLSRSKSNPLLFRYDIKFYVVGDLSENLGSLGSILGTGINSGIIGGVNIGSVVGTVAPNLVPPGLSNSVTSTGNKLWDAVNSVTNTVRDTISTGVSGLLDVVKRVPFADTLSGIMGSSIINFDRNGLNFGTNLNIAGIDIPLSVGSDGKLSVDALFNDTGTILDGLSLGVGSGGDGKLSPVSLNYALSALDLLGTGIINGLPDKPKRGNRSVIDSTAFNPSVNLRAVRIKTNFDSGDFSDLDIESYARPTANPAEDISLIVSNYGEKVDNTLLDALYFNIKEIDAADVARVKLIMLDAMTIPSSLVDFLKGNRLDTSRTDLERLISNIQVTLLDLQDNEVLPKELIRELRNLEVKMRSLLKLGYWGGEE